MYLYGTLDFQAVARTVVVMEEFGGLRVVPEFFYDGVPFDGASELHGNVSKVAECAGAVSYLYRGVRIIASLDCLDEGPVVLVVGLIRTATIHHRSCHFKPLVRAGVPVA